MLLIPSTAEDIDIAGVMNPSAIRVEHPINAGIIIHRYLLSFRRANKANIPPYPLLSAFNAKYIYLNVAINNKVQITQERPPKIKASFIFLPPPVMA